MPRSAWDARREVVTALADWGHPAEAELAVLLTSEIVTNAVVHAGPHPVGEMLGLVLEQIGELVRVEVTDWSPALPVVGDGAMDGASGRGLHLLHALATEWGVIPSETGKVVWFEVAA